MKAILAVISTSVIISCNNSETNGHPAPFSGDIKEKVVDIENANLGRSRTLTLEDAGKILGEPAHSGNTSTTTGNVIMHHFEYLANVKDEKSGKTGALYFLLEEYQDTVAAHKRYDFIKKANEKNAGVETLKELGDEAYYHSDGQNFYFVMVRKGNNVFNMKVNKITSHTSLEQFKHIYMQITEAL